MSIRKIFALGAALLLWCSTGHAEVVMNDNELPDRVSRGGIVASEVHPAPVVGAEKSETPKEAAEGCGRGCLPDFGGGL